MVGVVVSRERQGSPPRCRDAQADIAGVAGQDAVADSRYGHDARVDSVLRTGSAQWRPYADTHEPQVPIFVVTHTPPAIAPKRNARLLFTFVTDGVQTAVARAVETAGERAVTVVGGVDLTRQVLAAGLVDEWRVDVMPVLLGAGLRLIAGTGYLALEKLGVDEVGARTNLRLRVASAPPLHISCGDQLGR